MAENNEVKGVANYAAGNSQYNALSFMIQQAIREQVNTCVICKVVGVSSGYVDVLPMVTQVSGKGEAIPPTTLYKLPYMRYHAGVAAVILDPVPGDIGLAVFAQSDCSTLKQGQKETAQPGSWRKFDQADGFDIGGFINTQIDTYVRLAQDGSVKITAPGNVTIDAPTVTYSGDIICFKALKSVCIA